MPRAARVAPGGVIFHVLNRGNARAPVFDDAGDYAAFVKVLSQALAAFPGVRLLAYCLMPNHWHLVLRPRADGELGRFMQRLTVTHVRRWHEHRHSTGGGHVYQGTYKSFPVQRDEHFLALCRYVERNPLRAGLVRRAQDWRWGSLWQREAAAKEAAAEAADADHDRPAALLAEWPVDRPADWVAWLNIPQAPAEEQALAECIRRGRPFGSAPWQRRTANRLGLAHTFRDRGRPPKRAKASA